MKFTQSLALATLLFSISASAEVTFFCDRNPPLRNIEKAMITFVTYYNDPKAPEELTEIELYAKGDKIVDRAALRVEHDEAGAVSKYVVSRATTPSATYYEFAGLEGCNQEDPEYSPHLTIYTLDDSGAKQIVKRSNCDCRIKK